MKWYLYFLAAFLVIGCDLDNRSSRPEVDETVPHSFTDGENQEAEEQTEEEELDADTQKWESIRWHTRQGPSGQGARRVMTLDAEITTDRRFVRFAWDRYPWSGNGLGHFFVWDGSRYVGGKFEWIRRPGQAVKELKNIRNGYNGLSAPRSGTRVAFAWTSANGRERSNLVETVWP